MEFHEIPKVEKTEINLDALSFDFCDDDFIKKYYEEKVAEIADKDKWIRNHTMSLAKETTRIQAAVEAGLIPDGKPETIWQYNVNRLEHSAGKLIKIKNDLEKALPLILEKVRTQLNHYLPGWEAKKGEIKFGIYERADFRIDFNTIFIDLDRLQFIENFTENISEGLSHELFHFWISENSDWADHKIDEYNNEQIKERGIYKIIDEGLAVLISEQSLQKHHEKQGTDYQEFEKKSFQDFYEFQKENDREKLLEYDKKFKNMGEFYVVGYKIVKTVLEKLGLEKFKAMILEAKNGNPQVFIEEYEKIKA